MIRKKAVGVLAIIIGGALIGYVLFFNAVIKSLVISQAEKSLKMTVEIENVQLSFSPFGLVLKDVGVVSKDNPEEYTFKSSRVAMLFQLGDILQGRLIINELVAEQVEQNIPRKGIQAEKKKHSKAEKDDIAKGTEEVSPSRQKVDQLAATEASSSSPKFDPAVLDSFDLELKKAAKDIEIQFQSDYETLNESLNQVKNSDSLENLETQFNSIIKNITQKDTKATKTAFDSLLKEAKQLKTEISDQRKQVTSLVTKQKQVVTTLQQARKADYAALKATFQLESYQSGQVSQTLFGAELTEKIEQGLRYTRLITKVIQRLKSTDEQADHDTAKGIAFQFTSQTQLPRIWLKKVQLTQKDADGDMELLNLSSNPGLINLPMTVTYRDHQQTIIGEIDSRVNPIEQTYQYQESPTKMGSLTLVSTGKTDYGIESATKQLSGAIQLRGTQLSGQLELAIQDIVSQSPKASNKISVDQLVSTTIAGLEQFSVFSTLSGSILKPGISISSPLDKQLASSINRAYEAQQKLVDQQINDYLDHYLQQEQSTLLGTVSEQEKVTNETLATQSSETEELINAIDQEENSLAEKAKQAAAKEIEKQKKQLEAELEAKTEEVKEQAEELFKSLF